MDVIEEIPAVSHRRSRSFLLTSFPFPHISTPQQCTAGCHISAFVSIFFGIQKSSVQFPSFSFSFFPFSNPLPTCDHHYLLDWMFSHSICRWLIVNPAREMLRCSSLTHHRFYPRVQQFYYRQLHENSKGFEMDL